MFHIYMAHRNYNFFFPRTTSKCLVLSTQQVKYSFKSGHNNPPFYILVLIIKLWFNCLSLKYSIEKAIPS